MGIPSKTLLMAAVVVLPAAGQELAPVTVPGWMVTVRDTLHQPACGGAIVAITSTTFTVATASHCLAHYAEILADGVLTDDGQACGAYVRHPAGELGSAVAARELKGDWVLLQVPRPSNDPCPLKALTVKPTPPVEGQRVDMYFWRNPDGACLLPNPTVATLFLLPARVAPAVRWLAARQGLTQDVDKQAYGAGAASYTPCDGDSGGPIVDMNGELRGSISAETHAPLASIALDGDVVDGFHLCYVVKDVKGCELFMTARPKLWKGPVRENPWTLNRTSDMRKLGSEPVDGIKSMPEASRSNP